MNKRSKKVVKYKKPFHLNLGVMLLIVILVYLVAQIVMYFNNERLAFYEVTQNKIAENNTYDGFILRDETIISSTQSGYINYYVGEGEKVASNKPIYTLDPTGAMYDLLSGEEPTDELTTNDINEIRANIAKYKRDYTESNYTSVYDYKYSMENAILDLTNINLLDTIRELSQKQGITTTYQVVKTKASGIISYFHDGYESMTLDDITEALFDDSQYRKEQLRSTELKEANSPVYKMINSESWQVVIPLDSIQYEELKEKQSVKVTFMKDKQQTSANISFIEKEDKHYGVLSLDNYMLRYLGERYIELEIEMNASAGYKVPHSAIASNQYYIIPTSFLTKGGNNNKDGVAVLLSDGNGGNTVEFKEISIFYQDEDFAYIDMSSIADKTVIQLADSTAEEQERYQISEKVTFSGVYNVNDGYPVFKRIEVLYENEEYCLLAMNTKNGLSNYDRIILNVALARELEYIK